jgi:hypothetical protein
MLSKRFQISQCYQMGRTSHHKNVFFLRKAVLLNGFETAQCYQMVFKYLSPIGFQTRHCFRMGLKPASVIKTDTKWVLTGTMRPPWPTKPTNQRSQPSLNPAITARWAPKSDSVSKCDPLTRQGTKWAPRPGSATKWPLVRAVLPNGSHTSRCF